MNCLPLSRALNQVWAELTSLGVKAMPELVFDEFGDWMRVIDILPAETLAAGKTAMLCGFRFEYAKKPVNEADRFVAQEIGA